MMSTARISIVFLLAFGAAAQQPSKTGPAVGSHIPDFSAIDQDGKVKTLRSIMGPKGAMLVFFRSADW